MPGIRNKHALKDLFRDIFKGMKSYTDQDISALSPTEFGTLERRTKRVLGRRGITLSRSRAKDRASPTFGKYLLSDSATGAIVGAGYQTLAWVLRWIAEDDKRRGL